jgi:pimeloyl-ACP methyl ester carboxylesterase
MTKLAGAAGISALLLLTARAQETQSWRDPSKHRVTFVTVDTDVQLEVLDWGGSGRPLVLLTGSGNTAHVFDNVAPKLTDCCHVFGITRRGYGSSSHPQGGYDDQRLADDALRVIDTLHLDHPVLAGHSMGGGELTTIGRQHPERIAGLVYLDASADPVGDPSRNDPEFVMAEKNLPSALRQPPVGDVATVASFQTRFRRQGWAKQGIYPESEVRQDFAVLPDGHLGQYKASTPDINAAIGRGQIGRDYSNIRVPVLVFIDYPLPPDDLAQLSTVIVDGQEYQPANEAERAAITAYARVETRRIDHRSEILKRSVPSAHVVELPGAGHYLFLTREADVLREMHSFLRTGR